MEDNVIDIEKNMPHVVAETICVKCLSRNIRVYPQGTLLKTLECKNCGPGYVINTGEDMEE